MPPATLQTIVARDAQRRTLRPEEFAGFAKRGKARGQLAARIDRERHGRGRRPRGESAGQHGAARAAHGRGDSHRQAAGDRSDRRHDRIAAGRACWECCISTAARRPALSPISTARCCGRWRAKPPRWSRTLACLPPRGPKRAWTTKSKSPARYSSGFCRSRCRTCRSVAVAGSTLACYSVGGDCFDVIELGGGRHGFFVGDVSGQGNFRGAAGDAAARRFLHYRGHGHSALRYFFAGESISLRTHPGEPLRHGVLWCASAERANLNT